MVFGGMILCGCTSVRATYLADGQKGYMISCGGPMKRWSSCVTRAGLVCGPRGYTIRYSDEIERELVVACTAGRDALAAAPR
jgi:hypothetical protein